MLAVKCPRKSGLAALARTHDRHRGVAAQAVAQGASGEAREHA
jgi:hypothetical protein